MHSMGNKEYDSDFFSCGQPTFRMNEHLQISNEKLKKNDQSSKFIMEW